MHIKLTFTHIYAYVHTHAHTQAQHINSMQHEKTFLFLKKQLLSLHDSLLPAENLLKRLREERMAGLEFNHVF